MKTAPLEDKTIADVLQQGVEQGAFPGAAAGIAVGLGGKRRCRVICRGHRTLLPQPEDLTEDTVFDLASLTKPLATVLSILYLITNGRLRLDDVVGDLLDIDAPAEKRDITLFHLLTHSSGLPAHRPFFESLREIPTDRRQEEMLTAILKTPCEHAAGQQALYSDLGFLLLGFIVEKITGQRLDRFAADHLYPRLGLADPPFFRPLPAASDQKKYAATENCPWRGRILRGEVHDDNAFVLGGVAGHAGLFGSARSVLSLCCLLLDLWKGVAATPAFSQAMLATFLTRQTRIPHSTWAMGFDTPSTANSSAGSLFSPLSVGHLGFTGASFWIDPEQDLVAVLLTNRVHPSRDNLLIRQFRPLFHDTVAGCIR